MKAAMPSANAPVPASTQKLVRKKSASEGSLAAH